MQAYYVYLQDTSTQFKHRIQLCVKNAWYHTVNWSFPSPPDTYILYIFYLSRNISSIKQDKSNVTLLVCLLSANVCARLFLTNQYTDQTCTEQSRLAKPQQKSSSLSSVEFCSLWYRRICFTMDIKHSNQREASSLLYFSSMRHSLYHTCTYTTQT